MQQIKKILSKNEALVLYGICNRPKANDHELEAFLNINDSTITYNRKNLEKNQIYKVIYVPTVNRLGANILNITFTSYSSTFDPQKWINHKNSEPLNEDHHIFLEIADFEQGFHLGFNRDYSDFKSRQAFRTEYLAKENLLTRNTPQSTLFSLKNCEFRQFFDYSAIIGHFLKTQHKINLEIDKEDTWDWFADGPEYKFKGKDREVFDMLINRPDSSIKEIAAEKTINLHRHTVAQRRQTFLDDKLMRKMIVLSPEKIGYTLLVIYSYQFNAYSQLRNEALSFLMNYSSIFFVSDKFNAIQMVVYKNFSDFKEDKKKKMKFLFDNHYINEIPNIQVYSTKLFSYLEYFDFSSIISSILD